MEASTDTDSNITQLEVRETITEVLSSMTVLQRQIFALMGDDEMKHAQISRQLGVSSLVVNAQVIKIGQIMVKVLGELVKARVLSLRSIFKEVKASGKH